MEESTKLWNKKMDELTVGETMKLTAIGTTLAVAVTVAPYVIFVGGTAVHDKFRTWKSNRKNKSEE